MARMNSQKDIRLAAAAKSKNFRIVYEYFAHDSYDNVFTSSARRLSTAGQTSLMLDPGKAKGDAFRALQEAFNITLPAKSAPTKNTSLFRSHFLEAAYGQGKEINEITQLNSSALVALMCFYPVSNTNPMLLDVTANGETHRLKLTSLVLEKENPVYSANHPSSMDIALYGEDADSGEPVVLFLESKFGEYLTPGDYDSLSGKSYVPDYAIVKEKQDLLHCLEDVRFKAGKNGASVKGGNHYNDGIKQMVSHFIGANNSYELNVEGRKVYLGTILFDFSGLVEDGKALLDDYRGCCQGIARILNAMASDKNTDLRVIDDAFTYQEFFSKVGEFRMDEDVKEFYKL